MSTATVTTMKQRPAPLRDPAQIALVPIDEHPRFRTAQAELAQIEGRIRQAEQRQVVARARMRGEQPSRPAEQRAEDLMRGGTVIITPPAAELEAGEEELRILHTARIAKCEQLEQLRSELAFEVAGRFADLNAEALRAALDAATRLHDSLQICRVIRGRLIGGGYGLNENAIAVPRFPGADALSIPGDPGRHSMSPAGRLRDWLAERGII